VRLFSLSILTDKIVLVVQSCKVPSPPFPGMVIPVCRITNGGSVRQTLIVIGEQKTSGSKTAKNMTSTST
jgi:hypothetical protein